MQEKYHREITQLTPNDCFMVFDRVKDKFPFPLHFHPDYELNFIYNGKGVRRIVGDHLGEIDDYELVFIGKNLSHCWELHKCSNSEIREICIHFQPDLLDDNLLSREAFKSIKNLLNNSGNGVLFSQETAKTMMPRLLSLSSENPFTNFLSFISILHDLSVSPGQKILSVSSPEIADYHNSARIKLVNDYIQSNYGKKITLEEISKLVHMTPVSFNRFIKKRTGRTLITFVNDIRIGVASRMLLESDQNISEISYKCGFNNIANFNRIFKKNKNITPSEYRDEFTNRHKRKKELSENQM
jgi:AraC-like DNA-binding protein